MLDKKETRDIYKSGTLAPTPWRGTCTDGNVSVKVCTAITCSVAPRTPKERGLRSLGGSGSG